MVEARCFEKGCGALVGAGCRAWRRAGCGVGRCGSERDARAWTRLEVVSPFCSRARKPLSKKTDGSTSDKYYPSLRPLVFSKHR